MQDHVYLHPHSSSIPAIDSLILPSLLSSSTPKNFRVFINPMVNFIWIGGIIFIIGAHLSVLPDARERKRLEGAMALEGRAVA